MWNWLAWMLFSFFTSSSAEDGIDIRFRCHGDYSPPGELIARGRSLASVIYIQAGMESFNITCLLVHETSVNTLEEDLEHSSSHITNIAHELVLQLRNSTWTKTLIIPPRDNEGVWRRTVDISEFSMLGSVSGSHLLEDFLFTVELDNRLYKSQGVLMFYNRQPLTHWTLADRPTHPIHDVLSGMTATKLLTRHSPCSGSVWVVSPVAVGSVYLAVSFRSFTEKELVWYHLTHHLHQACKKVRGNSTHCDTTAILLKDLILTNYHIFLVTNMGFYVGSRMDLQNENFLTKPGISWTMVNPFNSISINESHKYAVVNYIPVCLDAQRSCIHNERIDITYHKSGEPGAVCTGTGEFLNTHWRCRRSQSPYEVGEITQIAFSIHSESAIILQWNEMESQAAITVSISTLDVAIFPTCYLPKNIIFRQIVMHPYTMTVFVFGDELWASHDLGATFQMMYKPLPGQIVAEVAFNADNINTEVIAIIEDRRSGLLDIAYGTLESQRMARVTTTTKPARPFLLTNTPKNVKILRLVNGSLHLENVDNIDDALKQRTYLNTSLAVEFVTSREATAYELIESSSTVRGLLAWAHTGMNLVRKQGEKAKIIDFHITNHGAKITLAVSKTFQTETDREAVLPYSLKISSTQSRHAQISLLNGGGAYQSGWILGDVNKTLVTASNTNFIITNIINGSTVTALAISDATDTVVHTGHWKIVDLSAGNWWLEEDYCKQKMKVVPDSVQHVIALDLGSSTQLRILSTNEFSGSKQFFSPQIDYSNPYILDKSSEVERYPGYSRTDLFLTDKYYKPSQTSLFIYFPHSSLHCTATANIYTVLLCCPFHKRIVFNYPHKITPQMLLDKSGRYSDILKDVPTNYRPPSALGVAIPLSSTVYNANSSQPLLHAKYKVSKETAIFKFAPACYKDTTSKCGCTETRSLSRRIAHSDCIRRAYRLTLPGWLYLCFAFELLNTTTNTIYLAPVDSLYNFTLSELNDRKDFELLHQDASGVKAEPIPLQTAKTVGVRYSIDPYNLRIKMLGSGIYHFKSTVPSFMSYCNLETEFVVYVDEAPVPYPLLYLMNFGVSIGMGFVMFLVYAVYRLNKSYTEHVLQVHRTPACSHSPTENSIGEINSTTRLLLNNGSPQNTRDNSLSTRRRTSRIAS